MRTFARRALLLTVCLSFGFDADASPVLLLDADGRLSGATGVLVNGQRYDVEFAEGTCAEVFGACDAAHFTFTTQSDAVQASQALLNQVLLDGSGSADAFDSNPALTVGCIHDLNCFLFTPYGTRGRGVQSDGSTIANGFLLLSQAVNNNLTSADAAGDACSPCFPLIESLEDTLYDSSIDINGTFVRWTVPEPAIVTLLGLGFLAMAGRKHRHRRPPRGRFRASRCL
jgi:hypothetical protein